MSNQMKELSKFAYHSDPEVKAKYVARVKAHAEADEIVQGIYWENGKGCAVGCTVEGSRSPHEVMEDELGIPRQLAYLEDRIFEGLANAEAKNFPLAFLKAITPGADLSQVVPKFILWLLGDPIDGVIKYAKTDQTKKAIQAVIDLYKRKLAGETIADSEWITVRRDADDAAAAAYAAAYAAYAAAADAAAAAYAAAYAARKTFYRKMADKLIELLGEAE